VRLKIWDIIVSFGAGEGNLLGEAACRTVGMSCLGHVEMRRLGGCCTGTPQPTGDQEVVLLSRNSHQVFGVCKNW